MLLRLASATLPLVECLLWVDWGLLPSILLNVEMCYMRRLFCRLEWLLLTWCYLHTYELLVLVFLSCNLNMDLLLLPMLRRLDPAALPELKRQLQDSCELLLSFLLILVRAWLPHRLTCRLPHLPSRGGCNANSVVCLK